MTKQELLDQLYYASEYLTMIKDDEKHIEDMISAIDKASSLLQAMTNEIKQAKETLKKNGYFTDNLWSVEDVQDIFNCSNEEAQEVLRETMTNEGTMHHIWSVIRIVGQDKSLKEN